MDGQRRVAARGGSQPILNVGTRFGVRLSVDGVCLARVDINLALAFVTDNYAHNRCTVAAVSRSTGLYVAVRSGLGEGLVGCLPV